MARQEALGRAHRGTRKGTSQAARNPRLGLSVMVNETWYSLGASTMVDDEWEVGPRASRFSPRAFLGRDWPYIAMLALAVIGVAYTSTARQAMTTYWIVLAPFFGVICVITRWRDVEGKAPHWQLIQTQTLHWVAVLVAMYLVFVADVKQM